MWTVLAAFIITFFGACNTGRQTANRTDGDTILLYKKDTVLSTSTVPSVLTCQFSANSQAQYDSRRTTLLLLDNPAVTTLPDGVYEVYISFQPPGNKKLSSSQPDFVNVLDLYSLTAPGAKKWLTVDISEHIKKLFLLKQPLPSMYIIVQFGGLTLPDGSSTTQAGKLGITGFRIVQTKN